MMGTVNNEELSRNRPVSWVPNAISLTEIGNGTATSLNLLHFEGDNFTRRLGNAQPRPKSDTRLNMNKKEKKAKDNKQTRPLSIHSAYNCFGDEL